MKIRKKTHRKSENTKEIAGLNCRGLEPGIFRLAGKIVSPTLTIVTSQDGPIHK